MFGIIGSNRRREARERRLQDAQEKRDILERVKEDARNEGRRDVIVNLKKYFREQPSGEPAGHEAAIRVIDKFMRMAGLET